MLDVKDKPYTVDNLKEAEETPWWAKDIAAVLQPQSREMLETYAGVSANQVIDHIAKYVRLILLSHGDTSSYRSQ